MLKIRQLALCGIWKVFACVLKKKGKNKIAKLQDECKKIFL